MGRTKESTKKMGRPVKEIDIVKFKQLCACFSTEVEICSYFGCCEDTLNAWCKRNYKNDKGEGLTFSEVYKKESDFGRTSLRSKMFQNAISGNNTAMQIFLAKNQLGMSDKQDVNIGGQESSEPIKIKWS